MDLEEFIKYLLWIVFFGVALFGIYLMLKQFGIM
jgi:hypothetical protein